MIDDGRFVIEEINNALLPFSAMRAELGFAGQSRGASDTTGSFWPNGRDVLR
jgi:hypothetical protein